MQALSSNIRTSEHHGFTVTIKEERRGGYVVRFKQNGDTFAISPEFFGRGASARSARVSVRIAAFLSRLLESGIIQSPGPIDKEGVTPVEDAAHLDWWSDEVRRLGNLYFIAKASEARWRHRARKAGTGGFVRYEQFAFLALICGNCCAACGQFKPLTCDHIQPLSTGGSNVPSNIQPLCRPCNSRKGQRTVRFLQ